MAYQQNYPQQGNWQQGGDPAGYQQEVGVTGGNPALAIFAAILGLGAAGALAYTNIDLIRKMPDGLEMPGSWKTMIAAHFVVAGIALLGAVVVFARKVAGAFILLVAGLLAVAAIALDPLFLAGDGSPDFGGYFKVLVKFDDPQATFRFIAAALGVVLVVISALPASLNYLRGSRR
jgi:hypothetical protein